MTTLKQSSPPLLESEPKPLRVEYRVLGAECTDELEKLVTEELNRTDCTVRLVGGISSLYLGGRETFLFHQAITRAWL